MNLLIATLPDVPEAVPGWLEQHLCGPSLAELAAELTALHGSSSPATSARDLLADRLPDVLARGLSGLPPTTLRLFLRQPALLLELQEIVLTEGGPYWDRLLNDPAIVRATERVGRRLRVSLGLDTLPPPGKHVRLRFYRRPWLVTLATAAAVLAVLVVGWPYVEDGGRWGWERPSALMQGESASAYLTALADAATEWRLRSRDDRESLTRAVRQMRDGCTRLLAAQHRPLSEEDRRWLAGKCRDWGAKLDGCLVDLQSGKEWPEVRIRADDVVEKLIRALQERARVVKG